MDRFRETEVNLPTREDVGNAIDSLGNTVNETREQVSNQLDEFSKQAAVGAGATMGFLQSNNIFARFAFIILVLILFLVILNVGILLLNRFLGPQDNPYLIQGMVDGTSQQVIPQDTNASNAIPIYRSNNEKEGAEFTWSFWLYISDLGNDTTLPRYGTLELDAGPGFASYLWSSFETSQKILATLPDWYKVTVTDSNGCSASDSIYILIDGLFPFGLEEEFKASDIKVFPNPARDVLNVISESSRPLVYWAIVSLEGQLLDYDEGSAERINIALLNSGKYMLWLRSDDGQMLSYPFTKSFR